ncbi:class I SAM-dependent methyltransferase [Nocardioides sp. 1609]|uniref:class I SAM-dependent methyltransferase n=1 Tax=Nocardioides sp. 1609 TaxID=2508327 RepID=UPI00106F317D|nr:class I SAM-dependent methyltransferase [Nocardioides sp. 1609]
MTEHHAPRSRPPVGRARVVNRLMAMYDEPRYLEIGVCSGRTFDRARAATKVAVDPAFEFDPSDPARVVAGTEYHQVTSDEYFGTVVAPDRQFDVIFLDGLHTVEQTLRDLTNALHHLQPRGVVVIDDVRPSSHLAAIPDRQLFFAVRNRLGTTAQDWMGDVFRLVLAIETFFQQLSYATVEDNHGQAIVWRKRRASVPDRALAAVGRWTFEELLLHEESLRLRPFAHILRELRSDLGLDPD